MHPLSSFLCILFPLPLHPTPFPLHPTPYTLHPTPFPLHPALLQPKHLFCGKAGQFHRCERSPFLG
ncbi:hypothetical protein H6G82_14555 [Planktothricoides sp. FACHB-1261]|nr:hypothetical protein [Planktothricoides raciborskii FACHB-1261]